VSLTIEDEPLFVLANINSVLSSSSISTMNSLQLACQDELFKQTGRATKPEADLDKEKSDPLSLCKLAAMNLILLILKKFLQQKYHISEECRFLSSFPSITFSTFFFDTHT